VVEKLPGKANVRLAKGERIRIETPGGGGWGHSNQNH
jgi:N-methylhydantoinase B/oxoprolinase/acetone carboxylase alpha subunit